MATILVGDALVLIDDDDAALVSQFRWRLRKGYPVSRIHGKTTDMHRLINNTPPGLLTDHINGNKIDNRRANLRSVTASGNSWNKCKSRSGTNPFKGVYHATKTPGRFEAMIRVDYRLRWLGWFRDPVKAARAYDAAALRYFGEFARPNFPKGHPSSVIP